MNDNNTPNVTAKITWMNSDPSGAKKATATITIADSFQIHGISVVEGPKGLFVAMPQRQTTDKNAEKKYVDVAHPVTSEMRKAINEAILSAYSQKMKTSEVQKTASPQDSSEMKSETTESADSVESAESTEDSSEDASEDEAQVPIMVQMA